jgi:ketosteroid isomerase-like protein
MDTATSRDTTSLLTVSSAFLQAWNRGDADALVALFDDRGRFTTPATNGQLSVPKMRLYVKSMMTAVPDMKIEILNEGPISATLLAANGIVIGTWTKPFTGPLAGITPTMKSMTLPIASFIKVQNGKIISCTQYYDRMALLAQWGLIQPKQVLIPAIS